MADIPTSKTASVAGIIASLVPLIGTLFSKKPSTTTGQQQAQALANMPPELQALIKLQTQNVQTAQPLYQHGIAATDRLLPAWARGGGAATTGGPSTAPPMVSAIPRDAGTNVNYGGEPVDKGAMSDAAFSNQPNFRDVSMSATTDMSGEHDTDIPWGRIAPIIAAALTGGAPGAALELARQARKRSTMLPMPNLDLR